MLTRLAFAPLLCLPAAGGVRAAQVADKPGYLDASLPLDRRVRPLTRPPEIR